VNRPANNFDTSNQDFNRGLDLFNGAHFFDAHEVLEDVWRSVPRDRPVRRHYQGMVQLAVAFHHVSTGNLLGAQSVLERALRNLSGADDSFPAVDLVRLRADLAPWGRYLQDRVNACVSASGPRVVPRNETPEGGALKPPILPKIMRPC